jgi:hypothetical protein
MIKIKDVGFWNGILDIRHTKMIFTSLSVGFNVKASKFKSIMEPNVEKKHEHYNYIHMRFQKK